MQNYVYSKPLDFLLIKNMLRELLYSVNFLLLLPNCGWVVMFLYARLQTGRIMVWWCPSVRHSFLHFSPTCFDILIWNFVYHFIVMHVRSSSNAINFRHFLPELCSFLTSKSYKYAVFRTFLLHALTYWVQILYMTLFKCTTEQVWVSSFSFNFCWSYASLWT